MNQGVAALANGVQHGGHEFAPSKERRCELLVFGAVLGTSISDARTSR
jgi:hypothetical protein